MVAHMPSGSSTASPLHARHPQGWRLRLRDVLKKVAVGDGRLRDLPWQVYAVGLDMSVLASAEDCCVEYDERELGEIVGASRDRTRVAVMTLRMLGFLRVVQPRGRRNGHATVYQLTIPSDAYVQAAAPDTIAYLLSKGIKLGSRSRNTTKATQRRRDGAVDNPQSELPLYDRGDGHNHDRRDGHKDALYDRRDGHNSYIGTSVREKQATTGVPEVTTDAVHIDRELITELRTAVRELQAQKRAASHAPPGQRGRHRRPVAPHGREDPDP